MTIKWNGEVIEDFDPQPYLEQVLVTYHMYIDKEVSHHAVMDQLEEIWVLLAEKAYEGRS